MANTASNVLVGLPVTTGGVLSAPTGSTLPTDSTTALDAAFKANGYAADDGVTMTINADTTSITAWGGDEVRKVQTSHAVEFKLKLIETAAINLKAYFGDSNVTTTAATTTEGTLNAVSVNAKELPRKAWVFDMQDGLASVRVVVPDGQVTDRGDVVFKNDEAIGYEITITGYPDSSGNKAYIYTDDGVKSA